MSVAKFNNLNNSVQNLIDWLDDKGIYGPIAYLEECQEEIQAAKEEYKMYEDGGSTE